MTIDIHRPDLETAIREHMATGAFQDVDELLSKAISALSVSKKPDAPRGGKALIEAFEPVRGLLTDEEVDHLFARDPSHDRDLELM